MTEGSEEWKAFCDAVFLLRDACPEQKDILKEAKDKKDRQAVVRMLDKLQSDIIDIKVRLMINKDKQ